MVKKYIVDSVEERTQLENSRLLDDTPPTKSPALDLTQSRLQSEEVEVG